MDQEVKFIFKTIMKVPVFIFISYVILNMFAFAVSYFRMLSFADIVMQVAVENNYLPQQELNTLTQYAQSNLESAFLQDIQIVTYAKQDASTKEWIDSSIEVSTDGATSTDSALRRRQYGAQVTCGVTAKFVVQWPLMPHEQVNGYSYDDDSPESNTFSGTITDTSGKADVEWKNNSELKATKDSKTTSNNITIIFTVPGLKYYPDMIYNG